MSYSDLYPERRGHEVSPTVLQRATGAGHPHSLKTQCERNVAHCVLNMPMVQVQYSTVQYSIQYNMVQFRRAQYSIANSAIWYSTVLRPQHAHGASTI